MNSKLLSRLLLVLLMAFAINSCKDRIVEPTPAPQHITTKVSEKNLRRLQSEYLLNGFERKLLSKLNDTASVQWQPQWAEATQKAQGDSINFVYIPLLPGLKTQSSPKLRRQLNFFGTGRFLVIKHVGEKLDFRLAIYLFNPSDNRQKDMHEARIRYDGFSGTLLLRGISTGLGGRFIYENGALTEEKSNDSKDPQGRYVCTNYWTCTWESSDNAGHVQYTTTSGVNDCEEPGYFSNYGGWHQVQTTIEPYCYDDGEPDPFPPSDPYDPGDGGNPGSGGSGGTGSGTSLENEATTNQAALFGPCPGLNSTWGPLINYVPPFAALNRLNNLTAQEKQTIFGTPLSPMQVPFDPAWQMQSLQNAGGLAINLDYFSVSMTELPIVNGSRLTLEQFQEYIRTHFNDFVEPGQPTFTPHPAIPGESTNWQNHNIGTIISIDITADPGSVILSDYTSDHWTFSTIRDPYNNAHPVNGNRTFGVWGTQAFTYTDLWGWTNNVPASYNFYIRGADRINYRPVELFGSLLNGSTQPSNAFQFAQGDILWEGITRKVAAFVNSHTTQTGTARAVINAPIKNRPYWSRVLQALQNNQPLSGVPCPD